jgi:hypothetical protein
MTVLDNRSETLAGLKLSCNRDCELAGRAYANRVELGYG